MASLPSKFAGGSVDVDDSTVSHHTNTIEATHDGSRGVKNDSKSENLGLKRKASFDTITESCSSKRSGKDMRHCMFVELPDEVLAITLTFLAHKDRLSVAITCKDSLKKVETFSERKWKEIQFIKADDTWETRLRDQSRIKSDNPKPLVLPHRYLLWKAYRTYLYALGEPNTSDIVGLEVLSDRRQAITADVLDRSVCQTWDLVTKRRINSFDFFPRHQAREAIYNVLIRGEHVIAEGYSLVLVWTRDVELVHRVEEPESFITALDADEQKVFFTNKSNSCLDIATGIVRRGAVTWQGRLPAESVSMLVLAENMLLVLVRGYEEAKEGSPVHSGAEANGIYVFDVENGYSKEHFFPGDHDTIAKASDDLSTIVASREGHVDVFKLENGQLSHTATFACSRSVAILLAAQSRVYIRDDHTDRVEVYSTISGELLYLIGRIPGKSACVAAMNGCELFLGYNSDPDGDGGPQVRAYCLDGY